MAFTLTPGMAESSKAEREGRKKDVELTPLGRAVLNLMKKAVKEKVGSATSPQGGSTRV